MSPADATLNAMNADDTKILQGIQRWYGRIVVTVGTLIGAVLCILAFTLGVVMDGGHYGLFELEIPTAVLLVIGLIYLKPLSLFLTRLLLSGSAERRRVLKGLTVAEIEKLPR